MSTKSTIVSTPAMHIYHDYAYQHVENPSKEDYRKEVLVIEASCSFVDCKEYEDQSILVVEYYSDFAKVILATIEKAGGSEFMKEIHLKAREGKQ